MVGKMLPCLQECIKSWTKSAILPLILGLLSDITRNGADLKVENEMLCQQLIVINLRSRVRKKMPNRRTRGA